MMIIVTVVVVVLFLFIANPIKIRYLDYFLTTGGLNLRL